MIEHSPALIAAALAEKHGLFLDDAAGEALCEALLTHPDPAWSEQMKQKRDLSECQSAFDVIANAAKPEPTEDHLRRACEELNVESSCWGPEDYTDMSVRTVARLLAERDALEAENSLLAAGCCINPGQHGLVGDEHGNFQCTAYEALSAEEKAHSEALARIAELEAERDAMQARVEGEPVAWLYTHKMGRKQVFTSRWNSDSYWSEGDFDDYVETPLYAGKPAEPTPDPDLVLAREAADSLTPVRSSEEWGWANSGALRALKLAKEQAHDR